MDILIKNIDLRGVLLLTPNAIFKPVEGHDHEKIVQKWEIVKGAEIKTLPPHEDLVQLDDALDCFSEDDVVARKALRKIPVVLERTT